jgi:hypothetical protein
LSALFVAKHIASPGKEIIMTKRNIIVGGTVVIIAILAIGFLFLQGRSTEDLLRSSIIDSEDQAHETAAEL